jgi:hypothetical protein
VTLKPSGNDVTVVWFGSIMEYGTVSLVVSTSQSNRLISARHVFPRLHWFDVLLPAASWCFLPFSLRFDTQSMLN